jgi:hypothetical protein
MTDQLAIALRAGEIVPGDVSGGPNTSHTIVVGPLTALLDAVPAGATLAVYEHWTCPGSGDTGFVR